MSLFGTLDIAERALALNQAGVRNTGHNIANVGNPAYSRQRQVIEAVTPVATPTGALGQGAEQASIQRVTDPFLTRQLSDETMRNGSLDAQARVLSQLEEALNEQPGEGLGAELSRFYDELQALATATTPGAPAERASLVATADALVSRFHALDGEVRAQQRAADRTLVGLVPEINGLLDRINELNEEISRAENIAPANDLRDQREAAIQDLSQRIDIDVFEQQDGKVVVLHTSGVSLVEGATARRLVAQQDPTNPFDPTFSRILYDDGAVQSDLTAAIGSGELGGLLRARDTTIPGVIRDLDSVAFTLIETVNGVHNLGVGLNGTSGDFFAPLAGTDDAARNIALDANVASDERNIAAGLTTAANDNRNALALAALRTTASAVFLAGDLSGAPSGPVRTVSDHHASTVADLGQQSRSMAAALDQNQRILKELEDRRDEVSGVSLDEEVTNLVRLQAAYQANARVISAVDEMLEQVLTLI